MSNSSDPISDKRLSFIQNDLAAALSTWNELENSEVPLSPDEEQLLKIKSLIGQLREKLEHF